MSADPASIALAFAAGLLSFASPCVLPLIPSYLSYVGGVSLDELREGATERTAVFVRTALFVLGFSLVFVVLGVLFSGSGMLLAGMGGVINVVAGGVVVLLGINMIFDLWGFLLVERRVHTSTRPGGYVGSVLVGMAFGAGWTPCIGPMLAGILFLAGQSGSLAQGVLLLSVYSLGLGLPFLAAGLFFPQVAAALTRLRSSLGAIKTVAGMVLILIGVLIALGRFQQLNSTLIAAGMGLRRWHDANAAASRWTASAVLLLLSVLPLLPWLLRRRRAGTEPKRRASRVAIAVASLMLVLTLLQATGVIELTTVAAMWLTYQGI
ncbi:MAG: cytochrome c biogenesis protein CcdA [Spirochaetaceae bacterium]|nr:MAG: cytochrome c biogenesis protein CcdA [Spirochaetaceae bacterium]